MLADDDTGYVPVNSRGHRQPATRGERQRVMVEDDGGVSIAALGGRQGEASGDLYEDLLWHCGRERG